jgi:hypothetical protein
MYSRALSKKDSHLIVKKRDYFLSMNESLGSEQPAKLEVRQFYAYSMSTVMASCHNAKRAPFLEAIR